MFCYHFRWMRLWKTSLPWFLSRCLRGTVMRQFWVSSTTTLSCIWTIICPACTKQSGDSCLVIQCMETASPSWWLTSQIKAPPSWWSGTRRGTSLEAWLQTTGNAGPNSMVIYINITVFVHLYGCNLWYAFTKVCVDRHLVSKFVSPLATYFKLLLISLIWCLILSEY